jgi:hypothetical protein
VFYWLGERGGRRIDLGRRGSVGFLFWYFLLCPWPSKKKVRRFLAGYRCFHSTGVSFAAFLGAHKEKQSARLAYYKTESLFF